MAVKTCLQAGQITRPDAGQQASGGRWWPTGRSAARPARVPELSATRQCGLVPLSSRPCCINVHREQVPRTRTPAVDRGRDARDRAASKPTRSPVVVGDPAHLVFHHQRRNPRAAQTAWASMSRSASSYPGRYLPAAVGSLRVGREPPRTPAYLEMHPRSSLP